MISSKLSCDWDESYVQVLQRPPQALRDPLDSISWNARSLPGGAHARVRSCCWFAIGGGVIRAVERVRMERETESALL